MATEVRAVWREGRILPLEEFDLEENTTVTINIPTRRLDLKSLLKLAGSWKEDADTYSIFKQVYEKRHRFQLRR